MGIHLFIQMFIHEHTLTEHTICVNDTVGTGTTAFVIWNFIQK